ncbi:protein of unknown function [Cupriavidus taiwanensis]|nr:protein of unknown function [Cupriavidus taiwanensis]
MDDPNEGVGSLLPAVSRGRLRLLRRLDCAGRHWVFARMQPNALCDPPAESHRQRQASAAMRPVPGHTPRDRAGDAAQP